MKELNLKNMNKLAGIAESLGISQSQLSILWCLRNKNVSTVILGASNTRQLRENLESVEHSDKVSSSIVKKINKLF